MKFACAFVLGVLMCALATWTISRSGKAHVRPTATEVEVQCLDGSSYKVWYELNPNNRITGRNE